VEARQHPTQQTCTFGKALLGASLIEFGSFEQWPMRATLIQGNRYYVAKSKTSSNYDASVIQISPSDSLPRPYPVDHRNPRQSERTASHNPPSRGQPASQQHQAVSFWPSRKYSS
jgi:hypothetical protein